MEPHGLHRCKRRLALLQDIVRGNLRDTRRCRRWTAFHLTCAATPLLVRASRTRCQTCGFKELVRGTSSGRACEPCKTLLLAPSGWPHTVPETQDHAKEGPVQRRAMSSLFADYERDFGFVLGKTRGRDLGRAERLVKSMELEARSVAGPAQRQQLLSKVEGFKSQLQAARQKDEASASEAARSELGLEGASASAVQRQRMLTMTERLNQNNEMLAEARRTLASAEESGKATLEELHRQREVIQRSQKTLDSIHGDLDQSNQTLKGMLRRSKR